jgi:hypothetical protein
LYKDQLCKFVEALQNTMNMVQIYSHQHWKKSGHILISALFVTEKNKSAPKMVFVVCESRLRTLDKGSCCEFKEFQDTW